MTQHPVHAEFAGPIVMIGFGSIGKGALPLILRHIGAPREKMVVLAPDDGDRRLAELEGVRFVKTALTRENLRRELAPLLAGGGFVVNVSVEVSSIDVIRLCRELGALYIDTCIEPWPGGYTDETKSLAERSNYALRETALALRDGEGPTAILAHGANPGMVSHLVKRALLHLAGEDAAPPRTREGWGRLARDVGVRGIHIAERDTQRASVPKRKDEFVNTWSIEGFVSEGLQPAELGWGTHEKELPPDGARHDVGCGAAIYLKRPGAATRVRSWTPLAGAIQGYLITHNEAISIADYLTLREHGEVVYRPTCHYAYHPSDDAILSLHELQGNAFHVQSHRRLMNEEIVDGIDELGVLLFGHARNAYWYGSQLSIHEARRLAPYQNATALQVTSAVLAGMVWAIEHPRRGVVEAEELDHARILEIMEPYLGPLVGQYAEWTPLAGRGTHLFPEDLDPGDPWQFKNVIVR
ncbi:MAG TPA: saccharopine dehydrogenase C-terminal domain-containing protein [Myxococcota bacterium]|nr:saccharopine dehydrogenase C-terminal domain-containing protein [Myxococcota bacterium]